jgi:hypothetical protein
MPDSYNYTNTGISKNLVLNEDTSGLLETPFTIYGKEPWQTQMEIKV